MVEFDYRTAFSRNLGFFSDEDQERLCRSRVAVAGLGGTGGAQVHSLARLGIGAFSLADVDQFELANFNRQIGATMSTIGRDKAEVIANMVRDINPNVDVRLMAQGVSEDTIDTFLDGVDVVVDSLDFYCFSERLLLYRRARERGLWVLTSPPLGFGFTLLCFDPKGMTFEDYFSFVPGMSTEEMVVTLVAGIAPSPFFSRYLNKDVVSFQGHRLPSVGAAPFMIAGVIATEVASLLTGKGRPLAIPTLYQFDALLRKFRRRTYPLGMRGPLQQFKKLLLRRKLK
jgi:molybdopterin/thiamine biosynthesis adenylyltransferase